MKFEIELTIKNAPSDQVPAWAKRIIEGIDDLQNQLGRVSREVNHMDKTVDDLVANVASEATLIGSLSTLTSGIKAQLDAALAGTTLPADVQAKINSVFDAVEANKTALTGAITANTPAALVDPSQPGDGSGTTGDGSTGGNQSGAAQ